LKLTLDIDLDDAWADDQSIALAIKEVVLGTIRTQCQRLAREVFKEREKEFRKVVTKRVEAELRRE